MSNVSGELRRARRLIVACVVVLVVSSFGLIKTARDIAAWIDHEASTIEQSRANLALERMVAARPDVPAAEMAMSLAGDMHMPDARIQAEQTSSRRELSVPLQGGGWLVWSAPQLGSKARAHFAPTRLPFILGTSIVVLLLLYRLHKLALVLEDQRVLAKEMARRDPLTGLGNRLAFDEEMVRRFSGAGGFALACIDLNGFKSVNDRHGHAAGDAVLRGVAARLRSVAGEQDAAFRLGGDEFALLIADDGRSLERQARRIVLTIDDAYTVSSEATVVVGASVGVAIAPQDGINARELLTAADAALYLAKAARGSSFRFAADTSQPGASAAVSQAA